ncbi:MAG TPA: PAS domain S-box protein [Melioribacteraceae bacterium]|nr:PAS domain S-box protein [Melioribacteraceae bacterium]
MTNLNLLFSFIDYSPVGMLIFDDNFLIKYINNNFLRFGVTTRSNKNSLINSNLLELNLFDNELTYSKIFDLKNNIPFELEILSQKMQDSSELKIILKGTPFFENNIFKGGILILDDFISENLVNLSDNTVNALTGLIEKTGKFWVISDTTGNILSFSNNINLKEKCSIVDLFVPESKNALLEILVNLKNLFDYQEIELYSDYFESEIIFKTAFLVINDSLNKPVILAILEDITLHKINYKESELKSVEIKKLNTVLDNLVDSIITLDKDGFITSITKNELNYSIYPNYNLLGKFISELIPCLTDEYFSKLKDEIFKKKEWTGRLNFYLNNEEIILNSSFFLIEDINEKNIILLCKDISKSYSYEKELKKSEEHYRSIVTNSKEFILTFNLKGDIKYINPHFSNEFKIKFEDALLLNVCDFIDKDEISKEFNFEYLTQNKIKTLELPLKKMDGRKIYVVANFTPVNDMLNNPEYYIGIFSDITSQKESEKDLLLIKTVFEASKDGIAVESDNVLQLVNDSFARIFGYDTPQEVIGLSPLEFIYKSQKSEFLSILDRLINSQIETNRFEVLGLKKNGDVIICEFSLGNYQIGKHDYIVMLVRDITEEKEAQKALEISEERYRSITENINEFIWLAERIESGLEVVLYTDAILKITGYSPNNFLKDKKLWYKIIHPNDLPFFISSLKKFYKNNIKFSDEFEYRIINKNGDIFWIKNKISLIRDKQGEINKLFGLVSDITLTKKSEEELKSYAESLKTLNETKDRFLSIISHDLRTPFSSILGFTDILLNNREIPKEKLYEYISFIHDSSSNMLNLVNSLLDWTRIQTGRVNFSPERINARSLINKSVQTSTGVALQKGIEIYINIDNDININADENLMFQVFNNLLSNSVKFCKKGDKIEIGAVKKINDNLVEFWVKDTGVGIKKEDQDKLFKIETKFTLQGTSGEKGSGLGLSLVSDIIKKHGGNIWVESDYGKGTKFIFTCPISSSNILLVDDVSTDRILYAKLLKSLLPNYNIIEAADGKEAIDKIKQYNPAIIITDHQMPEMSGLELIKAVYSSKIKFKPPFILLSMYLDNNLTEEYKNLGIEFTFTKPVNLTSFKFALEKSLKKSFIA